MVGVHLSLNGLTVPNNSNMSFDDIGHSFDKALICHTDGEQGYQFDSRGERVPLFDYSRSPPLPAYDTVDIKQSFAKSAIYGAQASLWYSYSLSVCVLL